MRLPEIEPCLSPLLSLSSFPNRSFEILRGGKSTIFQLVSPCLDSTDPFIPFRVPATVPSICIPVPGIGWKPVVPTKFQESANRTFLDGTLGPIGLDRGGGINRVPDRE